MVDFAYLSGDRLFVETDGNEPRAVESAFAAKVALRSASMARKNAWKTQGRGARFQMGMEGIPEELLQPKLAASAVTFTGLSRGRHATELMYTLSTGAVAGLFAFAGGEEERLFHGGDYYVSEPASEPNGERCACVVRGSDGQTHIGLIVPGQPGVAQVTVGDTLDTAPSWVPGELALVFESRALGYDRAGRVVDFAPSTIQRLDLAQGEVTPLVALDKVSCSAPRVAGDRSLFYIRRPVPVVRTHWGALVLDALLFPFRLLMAIVQWFNMFSLRHSGKPLITGGDSRSKQADLKRAAQLGNLTSAAANVVDESDDNEGIAFADSELVCQSPDGKPRVLAKGVRCFDVYSDGGLVWSDGRSLFYRAASGEQRKLGKRKDVQQLLAL